MIPLAVWAPYAARVEVVTGAGGRTSLEVLAGGWFGLDPSPLRPGDDYWFALDGGEPRPDPRSRWQPGGPHGPSRVVDPAAFVWTDEHWSAGPLADQILYELHIGTFTPEGTFASAAGRLDHLVELGVTAVEVMPIATFPGRRGWGYDGVDLFAVQDSYGGPHGFAAFVDACHRRGLSVVLDVVYNHLGPDGNYLGAFGPYFTDRYATPWGAAVNLDGPECDAVRAFFVENALMWLRDYHVDGLRLDAVHALVDTSAVHFLEQLAAAVDEGIASRTPRWLIAESDRNDPRLVTPRTEGGRGLTGLWSDDFHHGLHVALTGEHVGYYQDYAGLVDVAAALERGFVYDGRYSRFRRRTYGRPVAANAKSRLLGYAQNHDQIGNRATGDRLTQLVSRGRLEVAAALVLTAPFVPMLFQGEEWGASTPFLYFTDHGDPGLARAVSAGRRHEFAAFGWAPDDVPDPQDPATFGRSCLDWDEPVQSPHRELLAWHRALIALRREHAELRGPDIDSLVDQDAHTLVVHRGSYRIVVNLGDAPMTVNVSGGEEVLLASAGVRINAGSVAVPPDAVAILGSRQAVDDFGSSGAG